MNEFRKLRANEIDCRVATINKKGLSLLLYKDARVDMALLDETVGIMNWQRKHELINERLFCSVGIKTENGEWIWKQDVGVESYTEKEKGQASDSFKRACVNWGIGRELYTAPFIWVGSDYYEGFEQNGKWKTFDKFSVVEISYDEEGAINNLIIKNDRTGDNVYLMHGKCNQGTREETKPKEEPKKSKSEEKITKVQIQKIQGLAKQLNLTPEKITEDLDHFMVNKLEDITKKQADQYEQILVKRMTTQIFPDKPDEIPFS